MYLQLGHYITSTPPIGTTGRSPTSGGTGKAGNGTSVTIENDSLFRTRKITSVLAGTTVTDEVTRTRSGRVRNQLVDGTDVAAGDNFSYDAAGRLTSAAVAGHTLAYGYGDAPGCALAPKSGRNTNRTTVVDNGVTTTTGVHR